MSIGPASLVSVPGFRLESRAAGALLAALLVLPLTGGCAPSPRAAATARRQLAVREQAVAWTLATLADKERRAASNLERTVARLAADARMHERTLERELRGLGPALEADLRRWQRSEPARRDRAAAILWGAPENLDRTFILLFY